jgi:hypothetical protein
LLAHIRTALDVCMYVCMYVCIMVFVQNLPAYINQLFLRLLLCFGAGCGSSGLDPSSLLGLLLSLKPNEIEVKRIEV